MNHSIQVFQAEILDDSHYYNTNALSHYATLSLEDVVTMVEEGILEPIGSSPEFWMFSLRDFQRSRVISKLKRDLGVNFEGAAIIVDLLEK